MKYEDWIKYEQKRKKRGSKRIMITVPPKPSTNTPDRPGPVIKPLQHSWKFILQLVNTLLV